MTTVAVNLAGMTGDCCTAEGLLETTRPSLAGWYADPIAATAARALLNAAQRRLYTRLRRGGEYFPLHLLQMICHYWMHADCSFGYRQLSTVAGGNDERALLELVYGQLLMSGKRLPAREHLAQGFSLAAPFLDTPDYFRLLRRHELLAGLPLSETPVAPQDMHRLLTEAAVIRRLLDGERRIQPNSHRDTLG